MSTVGQVLFSFFEDHLKVQKGLRPGSIKSYRDTMKPQAGHPARAGRPVVAARSGVPADDRASAPQQATNS
jgi:integrase/recombinase XerD